MGTVFINAFSVMVLDKRKYQAIEMYEITRQPLLPPPPPPPPPPPKSRQEKKVGGVEGDGYRTEACISFSLNN